MQKIGVDVCNQMCAEWKIITVYGVEKASESVKHNLAGEFRTIDASPISGTK